MSKKIKNKNKSSKKNNSKNKRKINIENKLISLEEYNLNKTSKTKKIYAIADEKNVVNKTQVKEIIKNNKQHKGLKDEKNTDGFIIELENVEKTFTNGYIVNYVLKNINISIRQGEFVVVLGRSGSGKTTLMNILSGLTRASSGKTIVANKNLINLSNSELTIFRRKNIGYIFQDYGLLDTLTVYENVLTGFNLNKENNDKKIVDDAIDWIGLSLYKKKFPYELSGGQQQRVAIARAIAKNPKIIFGDEPTGAVDSKMSKIILSLLKKINKEKNTAIILITHDPEIAKIADVVYTISDGTIESKVENKNPLNVEDL